MKGYPCHFEPMKVLVGDSQRVKCREKSIFQKNEKFQFLLSKENRPLTIFLSNVLNIIVKYVRGDRSKSFLISILFLLFQCSMNSADIRRGEYLDKAQETTVEDFFQKRMKNRIKKVQGANWEILFESEDYIYFGYPLIKIFREGTFLEEFFKVDRLKLESDFPTYKKFDGIEMKRRCFELLGDQRKSVEGGLPYSFDCNASLEEKSILVNGIIIFRQEKEQVKTEKYLIRFDKRTLSKESIIRLEE